MEEKGIRKNRILCVGLVLAMLTTVFLVGMPSVRADENYDHTYTDEQGDVTSYAELQIVSGHEEIDIIEISSLKSGNNVILKMKVVGIIVDNGTTVPLTGILYSFHLDTNSDGVADYCVDYCNKYCHIYKEGEEFDEDISDTAS